LSLLINQIDEYVWGYVSLGHFISMNLC